VAMGPSPPASDRHAGRTGICRWLIESGCCSIIVLDVIQIVVAVVCLAREQTLWLLMRIGDIAFISTSGLSLLTFLLVFAVIQRPGGFNLLPMPTLAFIAGLTMIFGLLLFGSVAVRVWTTVYRKNITFHLNSTFHLNFSDVANPTVAVALGTFHVYAGIKMLTGLLVAEEGTGGTDSKGYVCYNEQAPIGASSVGGIRGSGSGGTSGACSGGGGAAVQSGRGGGKAGNRTGRNGNGNGGGHGGGGVTEATPLSLSARAQGLGGGRAHPSAGASSEVGASLATDAVSSTPAAPTAAPSTFTASFGSSVRRLFGWRRSESAEGASGAQAEVRGYGTPGQARDITAHPATQRQLAATPNASFIVNRDTGTVREMALP